MGSPASLRVLQQIDSFYQQLLDSKQTPPCKKKLHTLKNQFYFFIENKGEHDDAEAVEVDEDRAGAQHERKLEVGEGEGGV